MKSCGGTRGKTYKTIIETNVDLVFILTESKDMYLIPKEKVNSVSSLSLCDKYEKFKVNI